MGDDEMEWHHFPPGLDPKPKVLTLPIFVRRATHGPGRGAEGGVVPAAPRELLSIELRSIPRGMLVKNLLLLSEVVGESGCADWRNDRSEEIMGWTQLSPLL